MIDARCPVITPAHRAANRLRELARGGAAHGTCGLGIGETARDANTSYRHLIRAAELGDCSSVRQKLEALTVLRLNECADAIEATGSILQARQSIETLREPAWIDVAVEVYASLANRVAIATPSEADAVIRNSRTTIFEGAQGVLLDADYGFHPHTTWSTATTANATELLNDAGFSGARTRLGVLRTYATRHGAGPFITKDPELRRLLPDEHNQEDGWQGRFRVGSFDAVATRYALGVCPVDGIALTHVDRLSAIPPHACRRTRAAMR